MKTIAFGSKQKDVCRKTEGFVPDPGQNLEAFFADVHQNAPQAYRKWLKAIHGLAQLVYTKGLFADAPLMVNGVVKPPTDSKVREFIFTQPTWFRKYADAMASGVDADVAVVWQEACRACTSPLAFTGSTNNIPEAEYKTVKAEYTTAATLYVATMLGKSETPDDEDEA